MKTLRHLFCRSGSPSSDQRNRRSGKARRRHATSRRLSSEALEKRQLLAADGLLASNHMHNGWFPADVNDDRHATPSDALAIINYLAENGEAEQVEGDGENQMFYDVNDDYNVTPADALGVINALSRGEEVGELVELLLTARDVNDQPITPDGNGDINVDVGEVFFLEVSYDDLRTFGNRRGVFQLYTDISISQAGVLSPVLNETQRLVIDSSITSVSSDSVTFTIPEAPPNISGGSLSYVSPINAFANDSSGEVSNALQAFGYSTSQFSISELDLDGDLGFEIHWEGLEFGNLDLPDISVDVNETNASDNIPTQTIEIAPFLADNTTPNPDAVRFNINTESRTLNSPSDDEELYTLFPRGIFDQTDGFEDVGGLVKSIGQTRIQELSNDGSFREPFDAYSLPVFINSQVTDLVLGVNPGEDTEATLLFGRDDPVPQDLVLVESVDSGSNGIANVTINATISAAGSFTISPATTSVNENGTSVTLTVNRTGGSDGAVTVDFTTADGTAGAGSDYTATSGTLSFADSETSKTITVNIADDGNAENDETFTVDLSNPTGGATLGSPNSSTVTILDDDGDVPGTFSIDPVTTSVSEDGGTVTLTVNRAGGNSGAVMVDFATADGSATAGSDYAANSGTLSFADGVSSQTITITINDDNVDEDNETFTVDLSNATGGADIGSNDSSEVTILDDDNAGQLSISPTATSVDEGAGTVTLTVNRTGGTDGAVSVDFATANGSATAGSDYVANTGTLNFANGVGSQTITVSISEDSLNESDETFTVTLSNVGGGASLGANVSTVTILDNDAPGTLSISPSATSVDETAGTVTLTVNRTGGSAGAVSVDFATANGSATAGSDYVANSGTLNLAHNQTSQTITVSITDDSIDEVNETFTVNLSNATGGASLGTSTSTVTIIDNEVNQPPNVSGPVTQSFSEDDDNDTVSLLSGASDPDGDTLTVAGVTLSSGDGSGITVSGSTLNVTPDAYSALVGGASTNAVYTYTISDGINDPINQTATITITGVNDPPIARDDTATVVLNSTAVINVLGNDEAGGGEVQALTVISASSNDGSTTINSDGTISFTPNSGFLGNTTISYTVQDAQGAQNDATVNVTVQDFDPSSASGALFIDHVENLKQIIAGKAPIRNGIKDADEPGLSGVAIRIHSAASDNTTGQEINLSAITNLEGQFHFADLVPGQYTLEYVAPETVVFVGGTTYDLTVPTGGGVDFTELNFPIHATIGDALDSVDILASSYLRTNITAAQLSEGGREGGLVSLDDAGNQNFLVAFSGFEDIEYAELVLNDAHDRALLTVVEDDGDVLSTILTEDHFVVTPNGRGVQFFGGMNDHVFFEADGGVEDEFTNFRNAIDQIFS